MLTKGRCKHCSHEGLKIKCALGLDPEAIAKAAAKAGEDYKMGLILRIPCDSKERTAALFNRSGKMSDGQRAAMEQKAHCDKFTEPTEEEIAADEAEMDRHMQRMQLTFAVIARVKKKHDKSWSGVEKCPVCGNKLHLQLNVFFSEYQGEHQKHLHGRCETQGCVAWME